MHLTLLVIMLISLLGDHIDLKDESTLVEECSYYYRTNPELEYVP